MPAEILVRVKVLFDTFSFKKKYEEGPA